MPAEALLLEAAEGVAEASCSPSRRGSRARAGGAARRARRARRGSGSRARRRRRCPSARSRRARPRGSTRSALRAASSACVRANAFSASWSVARRSSMWASRSSGVSAAAAARRVRSASILKSRLSRDCELALAAVELLRMRREADLRVLRAPSVARGQVEAALRFIAVIASASSRSRCSTTATRSVSSRRSRPSSCSAAMRIARRRSCSLSIETGSMLLPAEKGHASMICAGRAVLLLRAATPRARGALRRGRGGRSPRARRSGGGPSRCEASARAPGDARRAP